MLTTVPFESPNQSDAVNLKGESKSSYGTRAQNQTQSLTFTSSSQYLIKKVREK